MICCICKMRIKAKEPKAYFFKGKRKVYGCRTCNEDGTLDAYIDQEAENERLARRRTTNAP